MQVIIQIRTVSAANRREHWAARAKRVKAERRAAYLVTPWSPVPCIVKLTRIAPRKLDGDNLQSAMKGIRDGIADRLKIDDGDDRIAWAYAQERGKTKEYAVRIEIVSV